MVCQVVWMIHSLHRWYGMIQSELYGHVKWKREDEVIVLVLWSSTKILNKWKCMNWCYCRTFGCMLDGIIHIQSAQSLNKEQLEKLNLLNLHLNVLIKKHTVLVVNILNKMLIYWKSTHSWLFLNILEKMANFEISHFYLEYILDLCFNKLFPCFKDIHAF